MSHQFFTMISTKRAIQLLPIVSQMFSIMKSNTRAIKLSNITNQNLYTLITHSSTTDVKLKSMMTQMRLTSLSTSRLS